MTKSVSQSALPELRAKVEPVRSRKRLSTSGPRLAFLGTLAALSLPLIATAGEGSKNPVSVEPAAWLKPCWLTDLSLGARESYDSNVFLSGVEQDLVPPGTTTLKDRSSWVTTISPKIGFDFAPLLEKGSPVQVLSLGYAPDFVIFHDVSSETYFAHRFTNAIKGKQDDFSFSAENVFTYVDGNDDSVLYPGALANSLVNGTIRERRKQIQDRAKVSFRYDIGSVFVRPTASLLYYDLMTKLKNLPGYQNFIDRYDVNGGVDFGYSVTKDLALTLGYRYGHQGQETFPWDVTKTSGRNDYHRALFGIEGKLCKWLKVDAQVGPDFRTYYATTPSFTDKTPTDLYAEATVTVEPTANDALVFKYKRWEWVSSSGKNPYLDNFYDLSYRHQLTQSLQLALGARAVQANHNPAAARNDWEYTLSAGLNYAVTANLGLEVAYMFDRGDNQEDGVLLPATREFERNIFSVGANWKF